MRLVDTVVKQPTNSVQKNKFSVRFKHPRAISICSQMVKSQRLSKYLERLVLRDSLTIGDDIKSLLEFKKKLIDEIKVEKQAIDTEIKRLKALKESHILSLQSQLEGVNKIIENKEDKSDKNTRKSEGIR